MHDDDAVEQLEEEAPTHVPRLLGAENSKKSKVRVALTRGAD